ncbi:MAG TPA: chemotaxis protein CheA [Herpetosiphonaceae bacterium]
MPEPPPNSTSFSFAEFSDDFFAECDEHLAIIRHELLSLERLIDSPLPSAAVLGPLFRSFHSLKGLAGMGGAPDVEALAHEVETYLRGLRDGTTTLTAAAFDLLLTTVAMLERLLDAQRQQHPLPRDPALLRALQDINLASAPPDSVSVTPQLPGAPAPPVLPYWQFVFTPSPALAQRQVTVNSIRERLQAIGTIAEATPRVLPEGGIAFEFLVATTASEATFMAWRDEGLVFTAVSPPEPSLPSLSAPPDTLAAPPAPLPATSLSSLIRVDLSRLDSLMDQMGALVISRSRLTEQLSALEATLPVESWRTLQETTIRIERQLRDLRDGLMRIRLVPVGDLFSRMQFIARDLARDHGKQVRITLVGQETEIDKFVIERMADPLLHLVRNAISHGVETPAERLQRGKPAEATLTLRAIAAGDVVVIAVEDDGGGIDATQVQARARKLGLAVDDGPYDGQQLLDLITLPGFSTRDQADRTSGRGIGMDVVRQTVSTLGGELSLTTRPGMGACFRIVLPITVSIVEALIVRLGPHLVAVPIPAVREVLEINGEDLTRLPDARMIRYRGQALPLFDVGHFFYGLPWPDGRAYALVLGHEQLMGMMVHQLRSKHEIVVRPLVDPLVQVPGCLGVTELGDGRPLMILDTAALMQIIRRGGVPLRPQESVPPVHTTDARTAMAIPSHSEADSFIVFDVAGVTYAVRSADVQVIDMIESITPVPNAPPAVAGVVFSRGAIIPALSLRVRFGLEPLPYDLRTRLIVIAHAGRTVGLIVDSAREFVRAPAATIQPPPPALGGATAQPIAGILPLDDRLIMIIDLGEVLRIDSLPEPTTDH